MSEAEKIYNVFRKLSAHPDSFEVGKVVEKCVDSVKDLETQLAEKEKEIERLRKIVIKVAEIAHMEAQDEFGLSWDDFKLNILYYRFEIMTDEEVNS